MNDDVAGHARLIGDRVAEIVAAYVSNNSVAVGDMPALIESVHASFARLGALPVQTEPDLTMTPAQIRKSITPDALTSFIDGKPYKALRRHLTAHGLDPQTYRKRYGLPADYPMVSASYSAQRADISRNIKPTARGQAWPSSTTTERS